MNGMRKPNQSLSSRLIEPLRPKINCIATAPTNGGITSGTTPSVWISAAPRKRKRARMVASGTAIRLASTTVMVAT